MSYIHTILPSLLMPIMIILIIITIELIKRKSKIIFLGILLLYSLSTPIISDNFFLLIEGEGYRKNVNSIDTASAIVVRSGMLIINKSDKNTLIEWTDPDRLFCGIELYKAKKLIFTAGEKQSYNIDINEGIILKKISNQFGIENENIIISDYAENTEEEAIVVKKIVNSNKIILVTSAYHKYRAKLILEKNRFNVLPYKVDFKIKKNKEINFIDFLPNSIKLENSEKGLKELFARGFYLIKFKIF
jgi:uncharacterized SAM-binding protein YcdF (DUF218 family)